MSSSKRSIDITIKDYISEEKTQILNLIDQQHRVLLQSNPASGKTTFFKNLVGDIKSGKIKGRLVFASPFLIISDQFANDVDVDLAVRSGSRKVLGDTDTVITSTFKSLHHIANQLTEDDLVIIDEAHALFYSYEQTNPNERKGEKRDFFTNTIQCLYHIKSDLVLMSGTPNLSLITMLDLFHIKIKKPYEEKAIINLEYTVYNRYDLAKAFARDAIKFSGASSLNIIYLKSVKGCLNIGDMLTDLGYKVEVITSKNKDSPTYNKIVEFSVVPNDVQFLVTTNVISTGTNIENNNIGEALMIDEFSALEIKQFSKRFRNQLDITVTVVNGIPKPTKLIYDTSEIKKQRNYFKKSLEFAKKAKVNKLYSYDYSKSYDKSQLGTPKHLSNVILDRYLRQECFFIDDAKNIHDKPFTLRDELNTYDDIKASVTYDYNRIRKLNTSIHNKVNLKKLDKDYKLKVDAKIDDFQNNIDAYLTAMSYDKNMDKFDQYTTRRITGDELQNKVYYSEKIVKNISSLHFQLEIRPLFMKYREYFKSTNDFLEYLKHKNQKNQNILPYTLFINNMLNKYFDVIKSDPSVSPTYKINLVLKKNIVRKDLLIEIQAILILIEKTYKFVFNKEHITIGKLKIELETDHEIIRIFSKISSFNILPDEIKVGKRVLFPNINLIKALLEGIFYASSERILLKKSKLTTQILHRTPPPGSLYEKIDPFKPWFFTDDGTMVVMDWGTISKRGIKHLNSYDLILGDFLTP